LDRDFGGLCQEAGIIRPEDDPAEANRGINLRLPERPIGIAGMA
jgi:hypothetical protein